MKKYDWKNEYNPIRRTAKRLLSGEPLTDGRPLSDLIELDEHTRKCLAFEATLTDRQIDMCLGVLHGRPPYFLKTAHRLQMPCSRSSSV